MDIYQVIELERAEREARRMKRREMEQRRERVMGWVRYWLEMLAMTILCIEFMLLATI